MSSDELIKTVAVALTDVIDPELGYNVVDLGLVYNIEVEDGCARILLTTTTEGCPATDYIRGGVEARAADVPGITQVEVTMTYDPPWTPDKMSDEAKGHFGVQA